MAFPDEPTPDELMSNTEPAPDYRKFAEPSRRPELAARIKSDAEAESLRLQSTPTKSGKQSFWDKLAAAIFGRTH